MIDEIKINKNYFLSEMKKKYLKNKEYNIVVQINGKKRGLIFRK